MASVDRDSPRYFVQHWRNLPQEKIDVLEEFMAWYELDYLGAAGAEEEEERVIKADVAKMRRLIDEFLEHNPIKAKQGEVQLLDRWIKATKSLSQH